MGAQALCPSARALVEAIQQAEPTAVELECLQGMIDSHLMFVRTCRLYNTSRDMSLAITHSEDAFFRALKDLADHILSRPSE